MLAATSLRPHLFYGSGSWKLLSKFFYICLLLEKLVNEKYFTVKEKFGLISRKIFFFYFEWKTLIRSCKFFRNIILFVDYIKFDPQTFDYYIFCFDFFFSVSSLRIWFNLIFISTLVLIFMIIICFSLVIFFIKNFYLSDWVLVLLIVIYFIWNNLWNCCYYFLISSSFNFFIC